VSCRATTADGSVRIARGLPVLHIPPRTPNNFAPSPGRPAALPFNNADAIMLCAT
jgi:hypothetical protein